MRIKTRYLGEVEITREQIIHFKNGLLGFEDSKEFVLLDIENSPYYKFLQNIKNSHICFILVNPWDFYKNYDVELSDQELLTIDIEKGQKDRLLVYTIVTLEENYKDSTTNLLAPVVINGIDRKGKQFILNDSNYTTKHRLFTGEAGE
jgi:flagellar assembly factor FliW